jgi:hypothetical protein
MVGYSFSASDDSAAEAAMPREFLHRAINTRWEQPGRPYVLEMIPLTHRAGRSVAKPQDRDRAIAASEMDTYAATR